MKGIARFFTLYWMIYFLTCIAYNDLPGFSSIDEVMTGILVIYTFLHYGSRHTNRKPWREFFVFIALLVFYIYYSYIRQVNVVESVWYDLMQQVRPYSIIYCTWILNPQFTEKQKKWMLRVMVATVITFIFYHPEMTDFAGENRSAPFGQLAICTSMTWYLFTEQTRKNMYIATAIAIVGLLGMKFKYYGQFGAWMFMLYYMQKKFKLDNITAYIQLSLLLVLVVILGWERFDVYYLSGFDSEESARPLMLHAAWQILWDYIPFGPGLGTFGTAASAVYYSPLWAEYNLDNVWGLQNYGCVGFHADMFYASLAQFGWFGIAMFIWFWARRVTAFYNIPDMRYYKVAFMSFFCLVIECFGDSSYLSGKGMGYFMLLGICLNHVLQKPSVKKVYF